MRRQRGKTAGTFLGTPAPCEGTIRHERQQPRRDHPLPTSKQAIRHPNMLANLKELLDTLIRLTAEKSAA